LKLKCVKFKCILIHFRERERERERKKERETKYKGEEKSCSLQFQLNASVIHTLSAIHLSACFSSESQRNVAHTHTHRDRQRHTHPAHTLAAQETC